MWSIVRTRQAGTKNDGSERNRRRGFSHPARFERLEDRLPLDAAPTAAPPTVGSNPVDPTLAGAAGVANTAAAEATQALLAFNTPSWIPDDRPPFPSTSQPSDSLPQNVNQVASTAYGIRNFEIGPNTSAAHSAAVRIGRGMPMADLPTNDFDPNIDVAETDARAPLIRPTMSIHHKADALSFAEDQPREQSKSTSPPMDEEPEFATVPASHVMDERPAIHLDTAAVDETMAEQPRLDETVADLAVSPVSDEPTATESPEGVGSTIDFLAASGAVAATMVLPGNQNWHQTDSEFWRAAKFRPERSDDAS
ncbi:MAG TPA: hypothetical protein VHC22_11165 [Pirellulales bacterium]|nr:hypothetical protein [Pirellulales bacterium]